MIYPLKFSFFTTIVFFNVFYGMPEQCARASGCQACLVVYGRPKDYFITGRANVIFCAVGLR